MEPSLDLLQLNFHHLRYFWMVAKEGHLTRTAKALRVSQSALSHQIRQLEEQLGEPLFVREGRALVLTEAGRVAMAYADDVFGAGSRLVATFRGGRRLGEVLVVGAMATLSRNFQDSFLLPIFDEPSSRLRLVSGPLPELTQRLLAHELDLVLSNRPVHADDGSGLRSALLARQAVSFIGLPGGPRMRFPEDLGRVPLLVPTTDSAIRVAFDALCAGLGVQPHIVAEVDDMALLRLLARDARLAALLPSVVVRDELRAGRLVELCVLPGVEEAFYAVTVPRHFQHPMLARLLSRAPDEVLGLVQA
jgi:LysR family transcriptional activator of nhaA